MIADESRKSVQRRSSRVGTHIRNKREILGLSQRALGQLFNPPVTTQFISNVERGVTPLPPSHVPVLARALRISEKELMMVLEQDYAQKLSGRIGLQDLQFENSDISILEIAVQDEAFFKKFYSAFKNSSDEKKKELIAFCESLLGIKDSS